MKKLLPLLILLIAAYLGWDQFAPLQPAGETSSRTNTVLVEAIASRQRDVQVQGSGVVVKLLPDDHQGSRHQRFILKVDGGHTVLVAHNIDLAPRIESLRTGDSVEFFGEYIWNPKGGVMHWTHHDPAGRHVGGWLKHQGKTYQ